MALKKEERRQRIKMGIRAKISGTGVKPRLSVFRSNTGIYAQLVDDISGRTIAAASTQDVKDAKGTKTDQSRLVGQRLAEKAKEAGISDVVFDRNGYLYHGRVKALAEGAREGGLQF